MALDMQPSTYQFTATNGEGCSEAAVYKRLYHESVERCNILQEQIERSKGLFTKLKRIEELKEVAIGLIAENKAQIDCSRNKLSREKQEWKKKLLQSTTTCDRLTQECAELQLFHDSTHPRTCGKLLAESALSRAVARVQQETIKAKENKENESAKVLRKMSKYIHSLQRENKKLSESLDFSEAERLTIAESNAELEAEIATYQRYLADKQKTLEEKQIIIDELRQPSSAEDRRLYSINHSTTHESVPSCSGCGQLREELGVALTSLNNGNHSNYGDLLRENFTLKQKLRETEREFTQAKKEALDEFERVTSYMQNYKMKSSEKVRVLKGNLSKADTEISELDQLIDRTRQVMHSEISLVKQSSLLLCLIRDLDGTEAPEIY